MFKTRGFIISKTAVYAVMIRYILHADITIQEFYKRYKYKMFYFLNISI